MTPYRYIPAGSTKVALKNTDAVAYVRTVVNKVSNKPYYYVTFYKSNKVKKPVSYYFRDEASRTKWISDQFAGIKSRVAHKALAKVENASRKAKAIQEVKVGDIYVTSWGYEQTNVDFYQVIEVKGASVIIRKIAAQCAGENTDMSDYVVAVPGQFIEEPMTKRVGPSGGLKMASYATAFKWDGSKRYRSWYG